MHNCIYIKIWKYLLILFRKQFLSMEWQGLLAVVEEMLEWLWQLLLRNIIDNFNQIMKIVSHYSTCSYYTAAGFFLFKKTFDFCVNSLRTLSNNDSFCFDLRMFLRNWVFDTNSNFIIPITLHFDGVILWYFKLRIFQLI